MSRPRSLSLDVSDITSEKELFALILSQFNFPDLYESNWKGMNEHLFYDPMMRVPEKLEVNGFIDFEKAFPDIASQMKKWIRTADEMEVTFQS